MSLTNGNLARYWSEGNQENVLRVQGFLKDETTFSELASSRMLCQSANRINYGE